MKYGYLITAILLSNILSLSVYHKIYAPPIPVVVNVNAIIKDKVEQIAKSNLKFAEQTTELNQFSTAFDQALKSFAKKHRLIIFNKGAVVSAVPDYTTKLQ